MADDSFFDTPTAASVKKHRIVSKYFGGWANIVLPAALKRERAIRYVDLFSGPGRYRDGTPSTPLLILQHAIDTPALHSTLHTEFNDENPQTVAALKSAVAALPGIERLKHRPVFCNRKIERDIIPQLAAATLPTLYFADPWGYAGISIDLIKAALTKWGSDILLFFNYNRINMNLGNELMTEPVNEFFTHQRAAALRGRVAWLRPAEREQEVLNAMRAAIKELGAKTELFTYRSDTGSRPTHHLLCVSRDKLGIALFKETSAKESSRIDDHIPSGDHNPSADQGQCLLFSPLDTLGEELVTTFAGQQLTFDQLYHEHHNGTRYIRKSYQQAVLRLEGGGTIKVETPPNTKRRPGTLPTNARISFPKVS